MNQLLRKIEQNQETYLFHLEKDLSEPCAHCGVPACGKEFFLFTDCEGQKSAIGFDGGLFEVMCEDFFTYNIKKFPYNEIPVFLRESNEGNGWNEWLEDLVPLNGPDLLEALDWMHQSEMSDWLKKDFDQYRETVSGFIKKALEENRKLYLLKT